MSSMGKDISPLSLGQKESVCPSAAMVATILALGSDILAEKLSVIENGTDKCRRDRWLNGNSK